MSSEQRIDNKINGQEQVEKDGQPRGGRKGRPRSSRSRKAILEATRKLLTHQTMNDLSIEAIAKKAGVGKTTIYRWWSNKAAVAMDAFLEQPGLKNILPSNATPQDAVIKQLENLARQLRGKQGRIIAGIVAESQSDPAVLDMLYEKYLRERVEFLLEQIEQGQQSGVFNPHIAPDIAIDLLLGPLFMRVLSGEHSLDQDFAENFPAQAVMALSA